MRLKAPCALCGEYSEMTGEHVIASWIGKIVGYEAKVTYNTFRFDGQNEEREVEHIGGHRESKIPVLCEPCNSEWSSQIQNETREFLKPVLEGERWYLSMKEREQLATWMSLYTIVRQFLDPQLVVIPPERRLSFYKSSRKTIRQVSRRKATVGLNGYPVPGINVWITKFDGDLANFASHYRAIQLISTKREDVKQEGARLNTYFSAVAFGNLVLLAFGSNLPSMQNMCNLSVLSINHYLRHIGMQQVWPNYAKYDSENKAAFRDQEFHQIIEDMTEILDHAIRGEHHAPAGYREG